MGESILLRRAKDQPAQKPLALKLTPSLSATKTSFFLWDANSTPFVFPQTPGARRPPETPFESNFLVRDFSRPQAKRISPEHQSNCE